MAPTEHVVLLDGASRVAGTRPKAEVHGPHTPLHLAFSCHVVDQDGHVLVTRRAATKPTWPSTWTNACCGHPQVGETLRRAVERRLFEELGLVVTRMAVAVPDFTYRAQMGDGTVEHERCPVLVAEVKGIPRLDAAEVDDLAWRSWPDLCAQAARAPESLSPWSVAQIAELEALGASPAAWLASGAAERGQALLDIEVELGRCIDPPALASSDPASCRSALSVVAAELAPVLDAFLTAKAIGVQQLDPALAEVTEEIRALVDAGGKRLRPAFVYWGHRATGADHDPAVLQPAAAIELLHTFALLHDDVMDRSATRRGRPSAHRAVADAHRGAGRSGDADWFGASAAILAGDLTYVWADELFDGTELPAEAVARARVVFTTLREEVIAGQYLDLLLAADPTADERRARHVALLKSARYTVTRPLLLGAALAPHEDGTRVAGALAGYGDAVGLAFQLRDDVLGLFGDSLATGKSTLDDLREGKRTVLMLRAMRLADAAQRAVLLAALGDPDVDEAAAECVQQIVVETGALASIEALLATQHGSALEWIDELPDPARTALAELADLAIQRRS